MIDKTTGEMVGIDFGHAFGSATELLPTPELMPFRLTPQLVQAMEPHVRPPTHACARIHRLPVWKVTLCK